VAIGPYAEYAPLRELDMDADGYPSSNAVANQYRGVFAAGDVADRFYKQAVDRRRGGLRRRDGRGEIISRNAADPGRDDPLKICDLTPVYSPVSGG